MGPTTAMTADQNDDFDILELSIWYNSSSIWRTPYAAFDTVVTHSLDRSDEFYIVGGYTSSIRQIWRKMQKLDLADKNNHWIELRNVTIPAHLASSHMSSIVHNRRLYIFSGQLDYGCGPATRACAYLNLSTHQWINLPDLPEARYASQAIISNKLVHLFGGVKPDRSTPALDYWILNLDRLNEGWLKGPSMLGSGDHGQSALIDGWIYIFGFEHGHASLQINHTGVWDGKSPVKCSGTYIAQPDAFKIDSKNIISSPKWIRLANVPHPVSHAGSILLNGNLILLIGGIGPMGNQHVPHVQLFDSRLDKWRLLTSLPITAKGPQIWTNKEQSLLYLQVCSSKRCTNQQADIIWSHQRKTEKCLFYPIFNCTTRKLRRTPYEKHRQITESKWNTLFSQIYLINMPHAVERLRRTWYELNRMDLTSITLFEGFQIPDIKHAPVLIHEDLLWPQKMNMWKAKNNTKAISNYIRSSVSIKLIFMNLWTRKVDEVANQKPVLIMEDDIQFIRSKDETFNILKLALKFLNQHTEIKWDLLYLGYRDVEATQAYEILQKPPISLWRASQVFSNTGYIVNKDPRTIDKLNKCYFNRLQSADKAICYCLKYQLINAYLIEPKLVQAIPGFSFILNDTVDYLEQNQNKNMLHNRTRPAKFNISMGY